MWTKLIVYLKEPEREAVLALADLERRDPRIEAGLLVVAQLKALGLIDQPPTPATLPMRTPTTPDQVAQAIA